MRIALVYDRVNKIGGAEQVLSSLHQLWPQAPLYTAVYSPQSAPWAQSINVIPSFVQRLPFSARHHEWYFFLAPLAFESFNFDDFDVVISVTSAEAKGIITKPKTLHLCYLLTPTKYLWSHRQLYIQTNPLGHIGQPFVSWLTHRQQTWDLVAAQRPDKIIAISNTVAKRAAAYYQRPVDTVIYPPVNYDAFQSPGIKPQEKNYYLLVSRLVPSKRVDLAIKAFNRLQQPLVIIGDGIQSRRLKRLAGPQITFRGQVSHQELIGYYQHCQALVFPQEEDFGIVALEAQAAGKPVIAFKAGGATETVIPGKTGVFFDASTEISIMEAIRRFKRRTFDSKIIKNQAKKFAAHIFITQFSQFVEASWHQHQQSI